jgi:hypothetical protein
MSKMRYSVPALRQLAEWAQSWVENETGIPEAGSKNLSDAEKGALMLIELILVSHGK